MREADVYVDTISTVISIVSKQFEKPELSELLTALGCLEAHFLAGITDPELRAQFVVKLRELVDNEIERDIADGNTATVSVTKDFLAEAQAARA